MKSLSDDAGIDRRTISMWFYQDVTPNISNIEACFNALGFNLEVTEMKNV